MQRPAIAIVLYPWYASQYLRGLRLFCLHVYAQDALGHCCNSRGVWLDLGDTRTERFMRLLCVNSGALLQMPFLWFALGDHAEKAACDVVAMCLAVT